MPIEIRELVIRTVVGGAPPADAPARNGASGPGDGKGPLGPEQTEQLVQECVRQVMLALQRERER